MICHPDYVPLSELMMRFDWFSAVRRIWQAQQAYSRSISDDGRYLEVSLQWMTPGENVEFCVLNSLGAHSFISGPQNQVSSFSQAYFRSMLHEARLTLTVTQVLEEMKRRDPTAVLPAEFLRHQRFAGYPKDIIAQAAEKGTSLAVEAWETGFVYGFTRPALFYDRGTYAISLSAISYVAAALQQNTTGFVDDAVAMLKPFEGWVWCTDRKYVDSGDWLRAVNENLEASCLDLAQFEAGSDAVKIGRPRKEEAAADVFDRLYPAGRSETWKVVADKVSEEMGVKVSETLLQRIIRKRKKNG